MKKKNSKMKRKRKKRKKEDKQFESIIILIIINLLKIKRADVVKSISDRERSKFIRLIKYLLYFKIFLFY